MPKEQEYLDIISRQHKCFIGDLDSRKYYLDNVMVECSNIIIEAKTRQDCARKELDVLESMERNAVANYEQFIKTLTEKAKKEEDELKSQKGDT